jgi:hypothetical protein
MNAWYENVDLIQNIMGEAKAEYKNELSREDSITLDRITGSVLNEYERQKYTNDYESLNREIISTIYQEWNTFFNSKRGSQPNIAPIEPVYRRDDIARTRENELETMMKKQQQDRDMYVKKPKQVSFKEEIEEDTDVDNFNKVLEERMKERENLMKSLEVSTDKIEPSNVKPSLEISNGVKTIEPIQRKEPKQETQNKAVNVENVSMTIQERLKNIELKRAQKNSVPREKTVPSLKTIQTINNIRVYTWKFPYPGSSLSIPLSQLSYDSLHKTTKYHSYKQEFMYSTFTINGTSMYGQIRGDEIVFSLPNKTDTVKLSFSLFGKELDYFTWDISNMWEVSREKDDGTLSLRASSLLSNILNEPFELFMERETGNIIQYRTTSEVVEFSQFTEDLLGLGTEQSTQFNSTSNTIRQVEYSFKSFLRESVIGKLGPLIPLKVIPRLH